jgi:uncharacterized surface protein with fasciclin (FAS1) repeats
VRFRPMALSTAALTIASLAFTPAAVSRADSRDNLIQVALRGKVFTYFCKAILAADMAEQLQTGTYTAFMPYDKAFLKLQKEKPGYFENLMKPQNKAKMVEFVKYHLVRNRYMQPDMQKLKEGSRMLTVSGKPLILHTSGQFKVNNSKVINPDMLCDNGVIQVVDTVLIPPDKP